MDFLRGEIEKYIHIYGMDLVRGCIIEACNLKIVDIKRTIVEDMQEIRNLESIIKRIKDGSDSHNPR
jgi:hypothetical protein